jgi:predicted nucleic acid-binding protein
VIVVDASVVVDLLLDSQDAPLVAGRVLRPGRTLHAPHLIDVELASAVRRYAALRVVSAEQGERALDELQAMRITRYPHGPLLARAWQLRDTVSAYDAMYVALAESLGAPLVTRDRKLGRAHGHRAMIEVL